MDAEELVQTLNRQMGELTTSIKNLETRVEGLSADVSGLKERMVKEESATSWSKNIVVFVTNLVTAVIAWWAGNQHG